MSTSDYTPDPAMWSFTVAPNSSAELHQQSALEYALKSLAETDHQAMHRLIDSIREEATEAAYHDPQVGIVSDPGYAQALEGLGNLLAAQCHRDDMGNLHRGSL